MPTAGAALPSIELALLGIPGGFTPAEIQSWLRDLGGVAIETSRTDERSRPIPQLLHHALTGLLFSQTELWSHTGQPLPCAAVFVHGPQGVAFGWVGRARVVLLVNGEPHEPQWVIVRDEAGQEAMSAALPSDSHVLLTLEYWPEGEDATQAPASLDAEWGQSLANLANSAPVMPASPAPQPAVIVPAERPTKGHARPGKTPPVGAPPVGATPVGATPVAATPKVGTLLPTEQPGLAPDPSVPLDEPDVAQLMPSTRHPSSGTFAMPQVPGSGLATGEPVTAPATHPVEERFGHGRDPSLEGEGHPVGRWLAKVIDFAKRAVPRAMEREPLPPPAMFKPRAAAARGEAQVASDPPRLDAAPFLSPAETGPAVRVPSPIAETRETPASVATTLPAVGRAPALEAARGLAAAGIEEILGKRPASASGAASRRPPGLATPGAPSASPSRSSPFVSSETHAGAQPRYPVLDVTPVSPPARGGMQIEREPVGADTTFAIPKLPTLLTPRPPKVVVPTAADMMRRDAEAAAKHAAMAPPVATPGAVVPPAGTRTAPPATSAPPAQSAAPPAAAAPAPVEVAVPDPPTEFLAEFAAALEEAPPESSAPPAARARSAEVATPPPPVQPPPAAIEPPPAPAFEPPPAPEEPVIPRGVSIMMARPNLPPPLPSTRRAAAVTAPTSPMAPPSPPLVPGSPMLRSPSASEPVPVAESEVPTLMRELPLPAVDAEPAPDEVPDGMLVATRSVGAGRRVGHGRWPALDEPESGRTPLWRNPWLIGAVVAVLFGVGWLLGHSQAPDNDIHSTPISRVFRSVGLGGARFTAVVDTDPPGAFISVDGKPTARRTPTTIVLTPGNHTITLSMPDLGEVVVPIKGAARQQVKVSEALHGSLEVVALDPSLPVKMSLDGEAKGFLPVSVEKLPPGLHEVQFSGPNMQPWGQTVNIGIRQKSTVKARPMMSPATGVVQVAASLNDEGGTTPLSGANVYVDGELRGQTPLTLELARGPHSLKVSFRGEIAPVQVIDLPGGNKRFASFQLGLDSDLPPLKLLGSYAQLSSRRATLVEASLAGLDWHDVREAWLHVRSGEGLWRRYQMTISEGATGALLSVDFPANAFDAQGRVVWYMSAATTQGDEFHSEIQRSTR